MLALKLSGETVPQQCLIIDDNPRNLEAASALGFPTILVGPDLPAAGINDAIATLNELDKAIDRLEGQSSSK